MPKDNLGRVILRIWPTGPYMGGGGGGGVATPKPEQRAWELG